MMKSPVLLHLFPLLSSSMVLIHWCISRMKTIWLFRSMHMAWIVIFWSLVQSLAGTCEYLNSNSGHISQGVMCWWSASELSGMLVGSVDFWGCPYKSTETEFLTKRLTVCVFNKCSMILMNFKNWELLASVEGKCAIFKLFLKGIK